MKVTSAYIRKEESRGPFFPYHLILESELNWGKLCVCECVHVFKRQGNLLNLKEMWHSVFFIVPVRLFLIHTVSGIALHQEG